MQLLPPIRAVQQGRARLRCLGAVDKVSKIQEDNWACDVLDSFSADTLKGFDKNVLHQGNVSRQVLSAWQLLYFFPCLTLHSSEAALETECG